MSRSDKNEQIASEKRRARWGENYRGKRAGSKKGYHKGCFGKSKGEKL